MAGQPACQTNTTDYILDPYVTHMAHKGRRREKRRRKLPPKAAILNHKIGSLHHELIWYAHPHGNRINKKKTCMPHSTDIIQQGAMEQISYKYLVGITFIIFFDWSHHLMKQERKSEYLLTDAHRSRWSIGHLQPLTISLCSGLLWPFQSTWSLAVSALLQCLASTCCKASLSSSSPVGSRSELGVWCWMLASWGCVRSSPTSSTVSDWPLVPVPLAPTDPHFGSSPGFCRCPSDRCWRMSESFVVSSVLTAMPHIRTAGLTSHWSWRCTVWFSCWYLQMPRCFWTWWKLLLPCPFWLWRLGLCLSVGQPSFQGRQNTPPP